MKKFLDTYGTKGSEKRMKYIEDEFQRIEEEAEQDKNALQKRARLAEIILFLVIACLLTASFMIYGKLYNKKKVDQQMQDAINAQVSQYFQLAASEEQATNMS